MDKAFITTLVSLISGAFGYLVLTFWMKPIILYVELRQKVISDLVYFGDVNASNDIRTGNSPERIREWSEANRRHSADLVALIPELPFWYCWYLRLKRYDLENASRHLIGLSNSKNFEYADKHIAQITSSLGIKANIQ